MIPSGARWRRYAGHLTPGSQGSPRSHRRRPCPQDISARPGSSELVQIQSPTPQPPRRVHSYTHRCKQLRRWNPHTVPRLHWVERKIAQIGAPIVAPAATARSPGRGGGASPGGGSCTADEVVNGRMEPRDDGSDTVLGRLAVDAETGDRVRIAGGHPAEPVVEPEGHGVSSPLRGAVRA